MSQAGQPASRVRPEDERAYLVLVREEIKALDDYCRTQLLHHRIARTVVITAGAAVPVLASWGAVPRTVIGLFGAVAAAAEGVAQLFQFQSHALNTLKTRNALERELNRFLMAVGRHAERRFSVFVERVEEIREAADQASLDAWQKSTTPPDAEQEVGRRSG